VLDITHPVFYTKRGYKYRFSQIFRNFNWLIYSGLKALMTSLHGVSRTISTNAVFGMAAQGSLAGPQEKIYERERGERGERV
jgi:hypothetical protein